MSLDRSVSIPRYARLLSTSHFQEVYSEKTDTLADLCSDLVPKITCQVRQPGLIYRLRLRTPASTLPTRFPAALGIGHGLPAA